MRKHLVNAISVSAIFFTCLTLQSCSTSETTYTTSAPGEPPVETSTTTTTTTTSEPDSVLGATANAAGTIIAAPFRLVGDALSIIF